MSVTTVETKYGILRGVREGPVGVWRGIPFAQAPIGPLRFQPPRPPEPWMGVRDATQFAPICLQPKMPITQMLGDDKQPQGEDCLYLNVWSPAADGRRRPVLFWIHGGAFVLGSGSTPWYNGASFAARGDVVVVTINYRLGPLGFLELADIGGGSYAASGNVGILDQVAALQWVRDNIAAFGGDPDRVTIFGESAGAMSVGTLLGLPAARGLFHQAILESGAAHNAQSRETASRFAQQVMAELGVQEAAALHEASAESLIAASVKVSAADPDSSGLAFQPVVDGGALPRAPLAALADGSARGIPVLIGTNRDEMSLFTALDPRWTAADDAAKQGRCQRLLGEEAWAAVGDYYQRNTPAGREWWTDLLTARTFFIPALRLVEQQLRQGAPVYMYRFDWTSPAFGGKLGATHALELPYVWNTLDQPGAALFTGTEPGNQAIADRMHAAWIAFAHNGDPNTPDLSEWPAYDADRRATLIFDLAPRVENDPKAEERRQWEGVTL